MNIELSRLQSRCVKGTDPKSETGENELSLRQSEPFIWLKNMNTKSKAKQTVAKTKLKPKLKRLDYNSYNQREHEHDYEQEHERRYRTPQKKKTVNLKHEHALNRIMENT